MPNNPIPVPRKTTPKDFMAWFFSGWQELIFLLFALALCIAAACFTWALEWQRLHGTYPTWAQFADVVGAMLGGAP